MQSAAPARAGRDAGAAWQAAAGRDGHGAGRRCLAEQEDQYSKGQTAAFFRGEPTGSVVRFVQDKRFADAAAPELTRIEFVTVPRHDRAGHGARCGASLDRRQGLRGYLQGPERAAREAGDRLYAAALALAGRGDAHVGEGAWSGHRRGWTGHARPSCRSTRSASWRPTTTRSTIEVDQDTHLPLQRAFEWRNEQFKDHDVDEEVYGDWRVFDGVATPMNTTNYRNGDMASQTFLHEGQLQPADERRPLGLRPSC